MNLNDRIWLRMNRKPAKRSEAYWGFAMPWIAVGMGITAAIVVAATSWWGGLVVALLVAGLGASIAWTDYKGGYADALHKQILERRERKLAILKK